MAAVRSLSARLAVENAFQCKTVSTRAVEKPRVQLQGPLSRNAPLNSSCFEDGGAFPQLRMPFLGKPKPSNTLQSEDRLFPIARNLPRAATSFRRHPFTLPSSLIFNSPHSHQSISPSRAVSSMLTHPKELKEQSESPEPSSDTTVSTATAGELDPSTPTKRCIDCGRVKALRQFQDYGRRPDGHHDCCRACLARFKARRSKTELDHLGLPVEEAWSQGKTCARCGVFQEAGGKIYHLF